MLDAPITPHRQWRLQPNSGGGSGGRRRGGRAALSRGRRADDHETAAAQLIARELPRRQPARGTQHRSGSRHPGPPTSFSRPQHLPPSGRDLYPTAPSKIVSRCLHQCGGQLRDPLNGLSSYSTKRYWNRYFVGIWRRAGKVILRYAQSNAQRTRITTAFSGMWPPSSALVAEGATDPSRDRMREHFEFEPCHRRPRQENVPCSHVQGTH
jgi:hypothetical protein